MSRSFLVGLVASLAVLVAAPSTLAATPGGAGTPGFMLSSIGASSFHIHINPFQLRAAIAKPGSNGAGELVGSVRCNDGTSAALVVMPDPGFKGFSRDYLSPGIKAKLVAKACPSGGYMDVVVNAMPA